MDHAQVLLSDLVDDKEGKFLKVKYIQKKSIDVRPVPQSRATAR